MLNLASQACKWNAARHCCPKCLLTIHTHHMSRSRIRASVRQAGCADDTDIWQNGIDIGYDRIAIVNLETILCIVARINTTERMTG